MERLAGILLIVTGVFHAGAWAIHDWNPDTMRLVPVGIVYAALGLVVLRGRRWSMVVAAIATFLGALAALMILNTADVPRWLTMGFIAVDVVIALSLALVLSRRA